MKKIYHVGYDLAFASIIVDASTEATDISSLRADPIEGFKQPKCRLADPSLPLGSFFYLNDTVLVFSDEASCLMDHFITHASLGELYPLDVDGAGTLHLLNVVETCNPLNKQESEWVPGSWKETIALKKLVFNAKRVNSISSLFKIPELDYEPILCFSGFTTNNYSQEHDFYKFYHEHSLTGLKFTEIWSDKSAD